MVLATGSVPVQASECSDCMTVSGHIGGLKDKNGRLSMRRTDDLARRTAGAAEIPVKRHQATVERFG